MMTTTACLLAPVTSAHAAAASQCPGSLDEPAQTTASQAADAITCLVNAERTKRGMRAVTRDADLGQAARRHSGDMVRRGYFSHVGSGGTTLGDRLRAAGYGRNSGWRAGEALGWGTGSMSTPNAVVDEWLGSSPHRHILLDPGYRELGVGVAAGEPRDPQSSLSGATYTVDFGVVRT
jgi:uncharacterized protein YkwD